jgi:hypothetical protein
MAQYKKFCKKHSFRYSSVECPFCLKERICHFLPKSEVVEEDRQPTENEIKALIEKFGKNI